MLLLFSRIRLFDRHGLGPSFQPYFGILYLAEEAKAVERVTEQYPPLFGIRLIHLGLFTQLPQPLDKIDEFRIEDPFQILFHESGKGWHHTACTDRHSHMSHCRDCRHRDAAGLRIVYRPEQHTLFSGFSRQHLSKVTIAANGIENEDGRFEIRFAKMSSAMDDLTRSRQQT